jgi:hypothetical protein
MRPVETRKIAGRGVTKGWWVRGACLVASLSPLQVALAQAPGDQNPATQPTPGSPSIPPDALVYYDADDVRASREGGEVVATGDVFFLVADIYIKADKITFGRDSQMVVAEGNVNLVRGKERIRASRVVFDQRAGEARMDDVQIITDPALEDARLAQDVLGFTNAELAFETSRSERTKEMEAELRRLRERYVSLRNIARVKRGTPGDDDDESTAVRRRYGQILERLSRTKFQPNLVLDSLPRDERDRLERRRAAAREFAEQNKEVAARVAGLSSAPGYVRLRARRLYQTSRGTYEVTDASVTPCRCEDDGIPIWGLSAREAEIEPDEYVTLRAATVDVATIPVGYTPWLKFPIKTKRQSGFLLPSLYASRSGDATSLPFFLTLGEHADATFTFNQFSQRGRRYDGELRAQFLPESRLRLYGEYIKDEQYIEDYSDNAEVIDTERSDLVRARAGAALTPEEEDGFQRRLGRERSYRYYSQDSLSIPLTAWASAKADGEFVSDNRYLTDFGKAAGTTQDLFSPNQTARRFLGQEAAVEYYGNDLALSMRAQGVRDTFALQTSDTPVRVPRVEFFLLPKRFFNGPIVADAQGSWERVRRLNGTPYADIDNGSVEAPLGERDGTITPGRNGRRDPAEPYLEGERSNMEGRLSVPLPANDYLNAYAGVRGVTTQYRFPYTLGWGEPTPYQTYVAYESRVELPMYGLATLRDEGNDTPYANVRQDFTPAVALTYIPEVTRSEAYPKTYQLFYEQDAVTSKQELALSFTTAWTVSRLAFERTTTELQRLPDTGRIEVADQAVFEEVLAQRRVAIEDSPEEIFALSAASESPAIFIEWAGMELKRYEDAVLRSEFGKPFVWPEPSTYRRGDKWEMRPLSLTMATTYNFQAEKTALERNEQLRPGDKRFPVEPWGDIKGTATWSLFPFVPLNGDLSGTWRRPWSRFSAASASVSTSLPYGLGASFSNSYTLREEEDAEGSKSYPMDRTIGSDISWQPLKWLRAQYQRKVTLMDGKRTTGEFEYSALQKISFLQLQDCLDITLQRFKDLGVRERYAVWSIGVNLRFLGQERNFDNAGASIDNEIQERNAERDPSRG